MPTYTNSAARPLLACLCMIAGSSLSGQAFAANSLLYVANNGVDGVHCGSRSTPCRSISQGIENAAYGDTIRVLPGIYGDLDGDGNLISPGEEHFDYEKECAVCITKRVSVSSDAGAEVTEIRIPLVALGQSAVKIIGADGVRFGGLDAGFTITGGSDYGVSVDGGSDVHVVGNTVLNGGILISPRSGPLLVSGNSTIGRSSFGYGGFLVVAPNRPGTVSSPATVVLQNNASIGASIFVLGNDMLITNNRVSDSESDGFGLSGAGLVVTHNSSINNGAGFQVGAPVGDGRRDEFLGNRAVGNRGPGFVVDLGSAPVNIHRNDIYGNDTVGYSRPDSPPVDVRQNCGILRIEGRSSDPPVDARDNYWGSSRGPGADPADNVGLAAGCDPSNNLVFTPFATTPFALGVR
jgi:hypothetical protein